MTSPANPSVRQSSADIDCGKCGNKGGWNAEKRALTKVRERCEATPVWARHSAPTVPVDGAAAWKTSLRAPISWHHQLIALAPNALHFPLVSFSPKMCFSSQHCWTFPLKFSTGNHLIFNVIYSFSAFSVFLVKSYALAPSGLSYFHWP